MRIFNHRITFICKWLIICNNTQLQILKELDREHKPNHTIIIKATEDCTHQPKNLTLPLSTGYDRISYHSALTRTKAQYDRQFDWFNRYKHSRSLRSTPEMPENEYNDMDYIGSVTDNGTPADAEAPYFESLISGILNDDSTLVQVIVYVQDINDNAPEFLNKVFTGGLTTAADFGTKIMHLKAIDKDDGVNAKINYYQIGEIHRTLTEGLEQLSKPPFLVDQRSGAVILNFDPQKGMKGYFDFMVSHKVCVSMFVYS